jgi:hypothetical protein
MWAISVAARQGAWVGGNSAADTPVLYHQVHGKWAATKLPFGLGVWAQSISASSATNVWAGLSNTPTVARLTKHGWVTRGFKVGKNDELQIDGVVATGPDKAVVLTDDITSRRGYAFYCTGSSCYSKPLPAEPDANSDEGIVSGSAANNIWSLAFKQTSAKTFVPEAFWYNGKKWRVTPFPAYLAPRRMTLDLKEILAVSPTNAWVTFNDYTLAAGKLTYGPVVLLHWNGQRWSRVTGKLPAAVLSGPLASDGGGGVWLSASNSAGTKAELLHFSRGRWATYPVPTEGGKMVSITALTLVPGSRLRLVLGTGLINYGPGGDDGTAILEYRP